MGKTKMKQHDRGNIITLRDLINIIFFPSETMDGEELRRVVRRLLPDIYDPNKTMDDYDGHKVFADLMKEPLNSTESRITNNWGRFLKGNCTPTNFALINETKKLLDDLNADKIITYKAEINEKHVTPRQNMINKIQSWLERDDKFNKSKLIEYYEEKELYLEEIRSACERLSKCNTLESNTYLVFLLFCISIFQWQINKVENLYDAETIDVILGVKIKETPTIKKIFNNHSIEGLMDKYYHGKYYVYMQKTGYNRVYKKGRLYLSGSDVSNYSYAKLELEDEMIVPNKDEMTTEMQPLYKNYEGETILNKRDGLVYSMMINTNGTMAILIFKYTAFKYTGMYLRTGLIISSSPARSTPIVQKIIISVMEIEDEKLIQGLLKLDSNKITIEKDSLDEFIKEYELAPWMEEFRKSMLPFIESHAKITYSFTPEELYHYSLPDLDDLNKIEIIELLKAYALNSSIIECTHLEKNTSHD